MQHRLQLLATLTMTKNCRSEVPNWGVTFTITNAWEAKCHAAMYGSRWQKETWKSWYSFLRTINVGYTRERGYYDIG